MDLYTFNVGNNKKRIIGLSSMAHEETVFLKSSVYFGPFADLKGWWMPACSLYL